jgi:hypothetical protein
MIVGPGWPLPSPSQDTACRGDVRPRIGQVAGGRRDQGVQVNFVVIDPDTTSVCDAVYLNGRYKGSACGGTGNKAAFSNFLTFPVQIRLTAWDDQGCLAAPVCLTVP